MGGRWNWDTEKMSLKKVQERARNKESKTQVRGVQSSIPGLQCDNCNGLMLWRKGGRFYLKNSYREPSFAVSCDVGAAVAVRWN